MPVIIANTCRLCLRETKKAHRCRHGNVCRANEWGYPECVYCRVEYGDRWKRWADERRERGIGNAIDA